MLVRKYVRNHTILTASGEVLDMKNKSTPTHPQHPWPNSRSNLSRIKPVALIAFTLSWKSFLGCADLPTYKREPYSFPISEQI